MPQDGNCLFHAAAYCISKLTKSELIDHHQLRAECVSHLRKHDQRYIHDWDGEMLDGSKADSFDTYCNAMANPKTWGSSFELQAIARMYDTKFVVFPQSPHLEVFAVHAQQKEAKHSPKMMMVDIAGHAPCALMSLSNPLWHRPAVLVRVTSCTITMVKAS